MKTPTTRLGDRDRLRLQGLVCAITATHNARRTFVLFSMLVSQRASRCVISHTNDPKLIMEFRISERRMQQCLDESEDGYFFTRLFFGFGAFGLLLV